VIRRSPTGVQFMRFLNEGTGITGRELGPTGLLTFMMNGVELQFTISEKARREYRNLRPVQWAGPEAIWVKYGNPISGAWQTVSRSLGTGSDDPMPESVATRPDMIAYYDSPGPNLTGHLSLRPSRIHAVQNFTGWVVGEAVTGGGMQRLCEVAAWHSVICLGDSNWNDHQQPAIYSRIYPSGSGTGWTNASEPPSI
jgi:hypothetical protein